MLDHYDYARALALEARVPGASHDNPYLVSTLVPLSGSIGAGKPVLLQKLTIASPGLAAAWIQLFMDRAASAPSQWNRLTLQALELQMRQGIAIAASGVPLVVDSINQFIQLKKVVAN